MNPEEWYKRRNDRLFRYYGVERHPILNFKIGVIIGEKDAQSRDTQVTLDLFLNITSRWCRDITIEIDETVEVNFIKDEILLKDYLIEKLYLIDPYGDFKFQKVSEDKCDKIIHIGSFLPIVNNRLWINSGGWIAGLGNDFKINKHIITQDNNVIGALLASCLGSSILMQTALGYKIPTSFKRYFSLFDYHSNDKSENLSNPPINEDLNLGNIHQVGAGAVGSSFIYLLRYFNTKGNIFLVDFDDIKVENLCSSLPFTSRHITNKCFKVDICAESINHSKVNVHPINSDYYEFSNSSFFNDVPPDIILCLANERNIWSSIQNLYPPIVFHATTTTSWGINVGRHIPLKEWCLVCRFKDSLQKDVKTVCSTSVDIMNENRILGVLPFLSPTSAILLLSELIKLNNMIIDSDVNFIDFSLSNLDKSNFNTFGREPDSNCPICRSQLKDLHNKLRSTSKYWDLTALG